MSLTVKNYVITNLVVTNIGIYILCYINLTVTNLFITNSIFCTNKMLVKLTLEAVFLVSLRMSSFTARHEV
jgi:hypothetical protein